jgi:hypothetical protein
VDAEYLVGLVTALAGPLQRWQARIWPEAANRAARRRGEREVGLWQEVKEASDALQAQGPLLIEN